MSNYEKITTGMGEECGVFGAYDMDGGDVGKECSSCLPWSRHLY